jgi:putative ABC transport system ATP-binding protein
MTQNQTIIEARDLRKSYWLGGQEVPVLKGINLSVASGEYVAIMGHSGAGKSTLLNILGCLDVPTSGSYIIDQTPVSSLSASKLADLRNNRIGFVFQNFNLLPKLSVAANVELPLIYGNVPAKERRRLVEQALKRFGIWERRHHKPSEISGGQKQRVAIARAIVKNPSMILADEPTGNLDSTTTGEILAVFDSLSREGNTIVVITHETDVAARASRLIRLVDGTISA